MADKWVEESKQHFGEPRKSVRFQEPLKLHPALL